MKDRQKVKYMGQKVAVYYELKRRDAKEQIQIYNNRPGGATNERLVTRWLPVKKGKPRTGWIVGFRSLQDGWICYEDHGGVMNQVGRVEAVMVCYWPTMKPVPVPLDGFNAVDHGEPVSPAQHSWDGIPPANQKRIKKFMEAYATPEYRDPETGRFKK